ncbi:hypothetical protein E2C01_092015 [Portunus trituberculatus]|uniref:Uncharacterized protein n=1 Tax=Portunus trituberculatus TaxID=210409 RepID=A0A5B7JPI3_PORTR|nr:hypothetical protein [Portunus trituberculatus]
MVATVETFPVVFKLLATLRMIIDGQTQAALKVSKLPKLGNFGKFYDSCVIYRDFSKHVRDTFPKELCNVKIA